ncbi:hypothetical protein ACFLVY_01310 [Chloroflexota bacterium]
MLNTWKPTAAGIITIISGCYGISLGVALRQGPSVLNQFLSYIWISGVPFDTGGDTASELAAYGILYIVFGAVALTGGIFALKRKVWGLALAGAILTLWMIPVGTVLGILSIVFLFKSKGEFV